MSDSDTTPTKTRGRQAAKVKGSDLVPDKRMLEAVSSTEYIYWVGVLPACPVEVLHIAGVCFPKLSARVRRDPESGRQRHYPYIGALTRLTSQQLQKIRDRLPWIVIRFTSAPHPKEPRAGSTDEDNRRPSEKEIAQCKEDGTPIPLGHYRRKGYPIRIPTPEDHEKAKQEKRGIPRYIAGEHDEPAARYVFIQRCENQDRPAPGDVYPEPLETTGLEWPEE